MVRIEGEIRIDRPIEEVFDFLADECNEPRYNPRMLHAEQVSDGPVGLGTRFRAELKQFRGTAEMLIEWTGFDRPRRLASTTRVSSMTITGETAFTEVPGGTLLRWTWELSPHGALKLLTPFLGRMGRRQEAATWACLKHYLERDQSGA